MYQTHVRLGSLLLIVLISRWSVAWWESDTGRLQVKATIGPIGPGNGNPLTAREVGFGETDHSTLNGKDIYIPATKPQSGRLFIHLCVVIIFYVAEHSRSFIQRLLSFRTSAGTFCHDLFSAQKQEAPSHLISDQLSPGTLVWLINEGSLFHRG